MSPVHGWNLEGSCRQELHPAGAALDYLFLSLIGNTLIQDSSLLL